MRRILLFAVLLQVGIVHGQARESTKQCDAIVESQPLNPFAWIMLKHCRESDARYAQTAAYWLGRPQPSLNVYDLPAHGTAAAKQLGFECLGGLAMHRIPGGYEQVRDKDNRFVRCRSIGG